MTIICVGCGVNLTDSGRALPVFFAKGGYQLQCPSSFCLAYTMIPNDIIDDQDDE